ncbi:MAG: peptide-methionine (S)-S-oxide reductase MsrA [Hyphomicrobiaceae bacterium]
MRWKLIVAAAAALFGGVAITTALIAGGAPRASTPLSQSSRPLPSDHIVRIAQPQRTAVATFASGCFWCTEADFDKVPGVLSTTSGFMGGHVPNPTYEQVVAGNTGHTEVVQVEYDPDVVTYEALLVVYWRNVDPFDLEGQFCDRGSSYRPAIFAHSEEQKRAALESRAALDSSGTLPQPIRVPVETASDFTAADARHQDFYKTNPFHYFRYRLGCGRDQRLREIWGTVGN